MSLLIFQERSLPCFDIIHRPDDTKSSFFLIPDDKAFLNLFYTVSHIQTAGLKRISLFASCFLNLIRDEFDIPFRIMMDCSIHCAAVCMSENNNQFCSQMLCCIFDASQLMVVYHVSGNTDHEQIADTGVKDCFRNNPGVRTRYDDSIWFLAFHAGLLSNYGRDIALSEAFRDKALISFH